MALAPAEIAPVVQRQWLGETARRHPTVMIGVMLLLAMAAMALLAPYLGTVDPVAVAPAMEMCGREPRLNSAQPRSWSQAASAP